MGGETYPGTTIRSGCSDGLFAPQDIREQLWVFGPRRPPNYARARRVLEEWYRDYPDKNRDLRNRFRNRHDGQHIAAWWELYIFTLYRRLGYSVTVHPQLPKGNPDFLVTRPRSRWRCGRKISMYIECAATFGADSVARLSTPIPRDIHHYAERVSNPDFRIMFRIVVWGTQQPRARDITEPIERWLPTLDPERLLAEMESAHLRGDLYDLPKLPLAAHDWQLIVTALPRSAERRGNGRTMLGTLPPESEFVVDDVLRIRKVLRDKGSSYGRLLDKSLVVALLNMSVLGGADDVTDAVLGSRITRTTRDDEGYWRDSSSRRGAGGSRVSGILFGQNLSCMSVATTLPTVWINPWASRPLETVDHLAGRVITTSSEIVSNEAAVEAHRVFGLPRDWPRKAANARRRLGSLCRLSGRSSQ
jgi:hypothetical protein